MNRLAESEVLHSAPPSPPEVGGGKVAVWEGDAVSTHSASRLDVMQSKLVQLPLALVAAWAAFPAESVLGPRLNLVIVAQILLLGGTPKKAARL